MKAWMALLLGILTLGFGNTAQARSRKGHLVVKSSTAGADVVVNGRRVGVTPLRRRIRLLAGTHTLRLSKLGYADYLDTVKIRAGRRTQVAIDLIELNGVLRIGSNPEDAEVILNGRLFGRTPLSEALRPGHYGVEVRLANYKSFLAEFDIDAGQEMRFNPSLEIKPMVATTTHVKWYKNQWVWISVVSAVIVTGVVTAVALNSDGPRDAAPNEVSITLMQ